MTPQRLEGWVVVALQLTTVHCPPKKTKRQLVLFTKAGRYYLV